MKWISLLFSFFLGRFNKKPKSLKEMANEIFDEISFKSKRLISLSLSALGSVILFCGGFLIVLMEASSQYDHLGYVVWTAMLASGLGLLIFSALIFAGIFMFGWHPSEPRSNFAKTEQKKFVSPLENALATLVLEYSKTLHAKNEAGPVPKTGQSLDFERNEQSSQIH